MIGTIAIRFDVVAIGAMTGLGYAILASGLVLIYRATKVINLAQGQIGAFAAALLTVLVHDSGLPYVVALPCVLLCGAALGWVVERTLVRPLVDRSILAVLVATIGVTDLLYVAQSELPNVINAQFPTPFNWSVNVGSLVLHGPQFTLLIFGPAVLVIFSVFMTRSRRGLAIRGVADNREAAQLAGISAKRVSSLVWVVAGAMAAIAAILSLPLSGVNIGTAGALGPVLGPGLLLRALAAGLAGRMTNLPATVGAGVAIGVVEAVLYASYPTSLGIVDLVLFLFIVAVLLLRGRSQVDPGDATTFGADPVPLSERVRHHPTVRRLRRASVVVAVAAAALAPLVFSTPSRLYLLSQIPIYAIVGVSIVMLTGWAGQLSLGQMAFVGVGAMGTAALNSRGVPVGAAIGYSLIVGVLIALVVGAPALRLRGLFLTVTTLGFAVATATYALNLSFFQSSNLQVAEVSPGKVGPFDFTSFRLDYYLCLVCCVGVIAMARRVRATGLGRTMIAVEGNEESCAAMTVSPAAVKLSAFAISGGIATLAGGLFAIVTRTFQTAPFSPDQSLQVLAMTVVGGIGSVAGAVVGAIYLVGLPDLFGNSLTVQLATSGIGLLVVLRLQPAGFMGMWMAVRDRLAERFVGPRLGGEEATEPGASPRLSVREAPGLLASGNGARCSEEGGKGDGDALRARGITVELGGRTIVSDVDITIGRHEVVGLMGSNGAGKSTLMNAITGFVPCSGTVELQGERIDHLSAVERARCGLGRSFQAATLYPRLSARECVQVALESQRRSELLPSLLALPPSIRAEKWSRAAADDILDRLGLHAYAERRIKMLSTGTRRIVEFACLLALRPRVVLLDEPMAGIAQRESEAFGSLLIEVRRELGAAMLVIEHDVPLVTSISDRLYCLESGTVIAEGSPDAVRNDSRVIASYLGTDERAIARSSGRATARTAVEPVGDQGGAGARV